MNHSATFSPEQEARWKMLDPANGPTPFVRDFLAPLLPPRALVLEYGAGRGRDALPLAEKGCAVEAMDLSPEAMAELGTRAAQLGYAIRTRAENALAYLPEASGYDAVLCLRLLHFLLPKDAAWGLLEKARARTKPGGYHALALFVAPTVHEPQFLYPERAQVLEAYAGWTVEYENAEIKKDVKKDGSVRDLHELSLILRKPA